jgi:hypothetical protein
MKIFIINVFLFALLPKMIDGQMLIVYTDDFPEQTIISVDSAQYQFSEPNKCYIFFLNLSVGQHSLNVQDSNADGFSNGGMALITYDGGGTIGFRIVQSNENWNGQSISIPFTNWGESACVSDLNYDGIVSVDDLIILMSDFGQNCN